MFSLMLYTGFALLLLLLFFKFLKRKKYNLPPGPSGKFFFGNLRDFFAPLSYKKWTNEFREKYGDVFLLNVVGTKTIIVNDYNLAFESFVSKNANDLAGRPYGFLIFKITGGKESILMANWGPRLKLQRKLVHSALRNYMKGSTVEKLIERSFDTFQELRNGFGEDYVESRIHFQKLFFNVICSALFGDYYDVNDPKNYEILDGLQQINILFEQLWFIEIAPFLWHFPLKKVKKMQYFLELFHNFALEKIQIHEENLTSESSDITDCFLNELKESDRSRSMINDRVLLLSIYNLMLAGTDTSAMLLYWLVGFLACDPSIQERIHEEITQYKKTLPPGENSVSISWREHLPYTQATILEGIRCASSNPQGIAHMALNDVKIGEYDVPKGTTVILNQYAFHNDPKFWKQPELFQPERFLDSDGKLLQKQQPGLTGFGLGIRNCIGESVAKADIFMLLVLLCSNYKFEWDPQNEDSYIRESELSNFTRIPASYKIAFKQREA